MGTNYAIKGERFRELEDGELHIGKKSAGWVFAFRSQSFVDPDHPISGREHSLRSFEQWIAFLNGLHEGERIVDEYGREISFADFATLVQRSSYESHHEDDTGWSYLDQGFDFIHREFS